MVNLWSMSGRFMVYLPGPGSLGHWLLDHLNIGDHLELFRFTWTWVPGSLEHWTLGHPSHLGLTLRGQWGGDIGTWGHGGPSTGTTFHQPFSHL